VDGPAQGHFYVDYRTGPLTKSDSAYEHPQPHACFIQSVSDDLVNEGGIMDLWVREARLFKYGSGTGTNFSSLRGEGEKLSGGGKSSGLMGFLKIGDRAAGAIKSGGTTRRAAKMVICDMDHPDIEAFINWKVIEEQKVASLVAGSKAHETRLNEIFAAIRAWDGAEADATDPARNAGLKAAIRSAKQAMIPETYVGRILQYARQGYTGIEFPEYDTDWQSDAYNSVSGQNSNNSVRLTDAFMRAVIDDHGFPPTDADLRRDIEARYAGDAQAAHAALDAVDPTAARDIGERNIRRIIRALEVVELTGRRFSDWDDAWRRYDSVYSDLEVAYLEPETVALRAAVDARAVAMIENGLLDEVATLRGAPRSRTAAAAIGYAEAEAVLAGTARHEDLARAIADRTWRYARRQRSWFRADPRCSVTQPSSVLSRWAAG
jgi:hypothetical protein